MQGVESSCRGKSCPFYWMNVDVDRQGKMTSFQAFCRGEIDNPVFLCSAEVRNGGDLAVDAEVPCVYPPLWVRPN